MYHLFQMMSHLHQILYLKSSNAVVIEKSNGGQTGVEAGNLTLHVWCFMHVRNATGVLVIRQGRLYRPMMMVMTTMMTTRYHFFIYPCNKRRHKSLLPYAYI